jgi:hypothetical protein
MDDQLVERILDRLRLTTPFNELPARSRPISTLWIALYLTLLGLRMPLYHAYLKKPAPKPKDRQAAIQRGLAMLATFAFCTETNQAIVTAGDGHPRSICFQPRPFDINWTAEHALSIPDESVLVGRPLVEIEDFIFLAPKVACAVGAYQAGHMPHLTATFIFSGKTLRQMASAEADVVVRELHGSGSHHAVLAA